MLKLVKLASCKSKVLCLAQCLKLRRKIYTHLCRNLPLRRYLLEMQVRCHAAAKDTDLTVKVTMMGMMTMVTCPTKGLVMNKTFVVSNHIEMMSLTKCLKWTAAMLRPYAI